MTTRRAIDGQRCPPPGGDFSRSVQLRGDLIRLRRSDQGFWDIAFNATLAFARPDARREEPARP